MARDADKAKLPADTLANQPHKAKRTISNSGLWHQPRKIAKKGTGKRSALLVLRVNILCVSLRVVVINFM
jgi:hypothetical protein